MRALLLGAALVLASTPASAVSLSLSQSSFSWGSADSGPLFTSLDLVDLGSEDPALGRLRIDLAGELHNQVGPDLLRATEFISIEASSDGAFLGLTSLGSTGALSTSATSDGSWLSLRFDFDQVGSSSAPNFSLPETIAWSASFELLVDAAALPDPIDFQHYDAHTRCDYLGWWVCDGGGEYRAGSAVATASAVPMPEPRSALLMAVGLTSLGLALRRRGGRVDFKQRSARG